MNKAARDYSRLLCKICLLFAVFKPVKKEKGSKSLLLELDKCPPQLRQDSFTHVAIQTFFSIFGEGVAGKLTEKLTENKFPRIKPV